MRKEDGPLVVQELVEVEVAMRGLCLEVGRFEVFD